MAKQKSNRKGISLLTIGSILLVLLIIGLIIYGLVADKKNQNGETTKTVIDTNTGQKVDPNLLAIYQMSESDRIKYYFNEYITYLEDSNYEAAYNLLDKDFKSQYFKTLYDFTKYVQEKYLPVMSVQYNDITRLGNYYVLTIGFLDVFNSTEDNPVIWKTQKFIIYENDYNDFVMSFQAE
ncbi:MAG: hypothetical protein FWF46_02830 [Oscillospiraceae bacterium]|nr:hypothetical protein [Oscillospiraceae bacterium]